MTQSEIERMVMETFCLLMQQSFGLDEEVMRVQESAWTSLKHIELILALEEKFDIRFTEGELMELKSLSVIKATVSKHLL